MNRFGWLLVCVAGLGICAALAQYVAPMAVTSAPAMRMSKLSLLQSRVGSIMGEERFPIPSATAQSIRANVVRVEDMKTHEVAFGVQVYLPERRGCAVVSEEEMADLKQVVGEMTQNVSTINANTNPLHLEYRAISGAAFGYAVHRIHEDQEMPPTAYVELPLNPYAQEGGILRLQLQTLDRMVAEAQDIIAQQRPKNRK